jgi:hypothetical protein
MVLLGTDPRRILLAVGLHLAAQDLGSLVVEVERVGHGSLAQPDQEHLLRTASAWWQAQLETMPGVVALAERAAAADPRAALPLLIGEIQTACASSVGDATTALLAVCALQRHGLRGSWSRSRREGHDLPRARSRLAGDVVR